jgi:hypothetical protein
MGSTNTHSSCLSAEPSHCCSKATADSLGNAKNVYRTPGSRDLSNFDVELEAAFRKAFGDPLEDSNTAVNSCPALADRHANKSVSAPPRKRRECRKFSPAAVATSPDLSQILWSHVRGHINSPLWSNRLPFGKFNSLYIHLVFYDLQRGPCSKFWSAATRMWKACAGIVMAMQQRQSR